MNLLFSGRLRKLSDIRVAILLLLGFFAGLPILLIFSTLSLWLSEAGASKSSVTYFSWAALGYSFKFVWAPLVDKLPLANLSRQIGRRKSWLLLSQIAVAVAIGTMGVTDPAVNLGWMAVAAVALGFSSATQDIVIDAYRIECADSDMQALLASCYIAGYRIGMVVAGAGSLYLAQEFGSSAEAYDYLAWRATYLTMAAVMLTGVVVTLLIPEPIQSGTNSYPYSGSDYAKLVLIFVLSVATLILIYRYFPVLPAEILASAGPLGKFVWASMRLLCATGAAIMLAVVLARSGFINPKLIDESMVEPIAEFFSRYGKIAVWVLLLIGFYRLSDIVMGVVANLFYQDMGFSKKEIASVTKVFGLLMTIVGSFAGGALSVSWGVKKVLLLGAVLSAATNLLFMFVASSQADLTMLTAVIAADNFCAGLAVAAFVAWLSNLTNMSFTAVQYAIFSSVMTLFPKLFGGYSGSLVESMGYSRFFLLTALLGLPVILLVIYVQKIVPPQRVSK